MQFSEGFLYPPLYLYSDWCRLDELEFITDDGSVYGPVGGGGGGPFVSTHPGCYLEYFSGSSGSRLDSLTLHWECP